MITGKPGEWYVTNKDGEQEGPFATRQEILKQLKTSKQQPVLYRMKVIRDDEGQISEIEVNKG